MLRADEARPGQTASAHWDLGGLYTVYQVEAAAAEYALLDLAADPSGSACE